MFFYDINKKTNYLLKLTRKKYGGYSKQYHYLARKKNLATMDKNNAK